MFVDLAEHDRDFAAVAEDCDAAPLWHRPCQWRNVVAWLAAVHGVVLGALVAPAAARSKCIPSPPCAIPAMRLQTPRTKTCAARVAVDARVLDAVMENDPPSKSMVAVRKGDDAARRLGRPIAVTSPAFFKWLGHSLRGAKEGEATLGAVVCALLLGCCDAEDVKKATAAAMKEDCDTDSDCDTNDCDTDDCDTDDSDCEDAILGHLQCGLPMFASVVSSAVPAPTACGCCCKEDRPEDAPPPPPALPTRASSVYVIEGIVNQISTMYQLFCKSSVTFQGADFNSTENDEKALASIKSSWSALSGAISQQLQDGHPVSLDLIRRVVAAAMSLIHAAQSAVGRACELESQRYKCLPPNRQSASAKVTVQALHAYLKWFTVADSGFEGILRYLVSRGEIADDDGDDIIKQIVDLVHDSM